MGRRLNTHVHVTHEDERYVFGPDDVLSGWAAQAITNPKVWVPSTPTKPSESVGVTEPPRSGTGATKEAWRAYATGLGHVVPGNAGRDEIIDLVDRRGD